MDASAKTAFRKCGMLTDANTRPDTKQQIGERLERRQVEPTTLWQKTVRFGFVTKRAFATFSLPRTVLGSETSPLQVCPSRSTGFLCR